MNYYRLGAQQLWEVYRQHQALRLKLNLCPELVAVFTIMENSISNTQKKKGILSTALEWVSTPAAKKGPVDALFTEAFSKMDCFQQIIYYSGLIDWLTETPTARLSGNLSQEFVGEFRSGSFMDSWVKCLIQVDFASRQLRLNNLPLNLQSYLVRKAINSDRPTFVLQPTRPNLNSFRVALASPLQFEQCFQAVNYALERAHREIYSHILRKWSLPIPEQKFTVSSFSDCLRQNSTHTYCPPRQLLALSDIEQEVSEIRGEGEEHGPGYSVLEVFQRLMPGYDIDILTQEDAKSFRVLNESAKFRLSQSVINSKLIKFTITLRYPKAFVAQVLSIPKQFQWNRQVQFSCVKQTIPSQNSALIYHKHRASPYHNTSREFLFVRHVFTYNDKHFLLDKSIDSNLCPKTEIPRSEIIFRLMWAEQKGEDPNLTHLTALVEINYKCNTSLDKEVQLTERYLLELLDFQAYLGIYQSRGNPYFDLQWRGNASMSFSLDIQSHRDTERFLENLCSEINTSYRTVGGKEGWDMGSLKSKARTSKISVQSVQQEAQQQIQSQIPAAQLVQSAQQQSPIQQLPQPPQQPQPPPQPPERLQVLQPQIELFSRHTCQKSPKCCTKNRYLFRPIPCSYEVSNKYTNSVWRDNWEVHTTGIVCVDTNSLRRQNNFYKYVIPTLTSATDIMNISLPAEICSEESQLELIARSMCLAPLQLERAAKCMDPVQRFKYCMAFGLGHCILSVEVQQPFTPLLGETFQGWINGCPIYVEQISVSPPVSYVFMEGRGYRLFGTISTRREISSNQLTIYSDGGLIIEFPFSKERMHMRMPTGEVDGLISGEKTFKFKDCGYFIQEKNCLFCELCFRPSLLKMAWSRKQGDTLQGTIINTSYAFIQKFLTGNNRKIRPNPAQSQMLSQVSGRWTQGLYFDGVEYYNIKTDVPCVLNYQSHPLPSDSILRDDILYRKQQDYKRAHGQRQRLENIQKDDARRRRGK